MEKLEWLRLASEEEKIDKHHKAIDIIFNNIDDRLLEGKFEDINEDLKLINIPNTSTLLLVAVLTITLTAYNKLDYRSKFFESIEQEFLEREGDRTKELLRGLRYYGEY